MNTHGSKLSGLANSVLVVAAAVAVAAILIVRQADPGDVGGQPSGPTALISAAPTDTEASPDSSAQQGLILVYQTNGRRGVISLLDLAGGATMPIGNVPVDSVQRKGSTYARVEWSADRRSATIFRSAAGEMAQVRVDLDARTVTEIVGGQQVVSPIDDVGARIMGNALEIVDFQGTVIRGIPLADQWQLMDPGPWSPDGSLVLLAGCMPCPPVNPPNARESHLYLAEVAGGLPRHLADLDDSFPSRPAAWSPDMASIAIGADGIMLIDVASGDGHRLTENSDDVMPVWSPDGTMIAFARMEGADRGLWIVPAFGGEPRRLTRAEQNYGDRLPVWSADGSAILFTRGPLEEFGDLWMVNLAGDPPVKVLDDAVGAW